MKTIHVYAAYLVGYRSSEMNAIHFKQTILIHSLFHFRKFHLGTSKVQFSTCFLTEQVFEIHFLS